MTVETYVAPSSIHGLGIFSSENIPAGTIIWKFDEGFDLVLDKKILEGLPAFQANFFRMYCYMFQGQYYYCIDNARFMNHSATANTLQTRTTTVTAIDIKAGEEITCDYGDMGDNAEDRAENLSPVMNII